MLHPLSHDRIEKVVDESGSHMPALKASPADTQNVLAFLSRLVTLRAGDLIMTGTPAGVGAVRRRDVLEGAIEGVGTVSTVIA